MNRVTRSLSSVLKLRACFSQISKANNQAPTRREYLQFSKRRLVDFGQLPFGQTPQALQTNRPTTVTKLSNGVRVATQSWIGNRASLTVDVKVGSRQQTLQTSSVSQFVAHGALQGTSSHSKQQIEQWVDRFGGSLKVKVTRQVTSFTLDFCPITQVEEAVKFISQVVLKPVYDATQMEALKSNIYNNAISNDPLKVTLRNVHYTSFRDHFMGQPVAGIRQNIYSITSQQIKAFHSQFYVGENIVVSGAGQINANQFNDVVNKYFGSVKSTVQGQVPNKQQPFFTPSLLFNRDDQIPNTSVGIGFIAPSWNDPDFFAMHYFKRIIGEYRIDKYTGANLNTPHLQYNSFHNILGSFPDISVHQPFYIPYSDTGIFGNFIFGNEIFNREMLLMTQNMMSVYAQQINVVEVFRSRNKYWNDLLERNDPSEVSHRNARQVAYLDRLIPRSEIATRISHMDPAYISKVATKWFWDKQIAITAWGPLHNVMVHAHYNRPYRRSTLGQYASADIYLNA